MTAYADNLRRPRPDEFLADLSVEADIALADLVAPEVLERATSKDTVVVVPHGPLHLLPWSALSLAPLAGGGAPRRLFEQCAVGVLPNLASLQQLDTGGGPVGSVALIGNADYSGLTMYPALTESSLELADIAAVQADRTVLGPREGTDATEAAFWELAAAASGPGAVLHFSGHGSLEATEPLARTGSDWAAHPTPQRCCCAGCRTTRWSSVGAARPGDRPLPVAWSWPATTRSAFRRRSSRPGRGSCWPTSPPIREQTARAFVVSWHRHRHDGLRPLAAYRAVQLELLAADPSTVFAWAGVTAYGCR